MRSCCYSVFRHQSSRWGEKNCVPPCPSLRRRVFEARFLILSILQALMAEERTPLLESHSATLDSASEATFKEPIGPFDLTPAQRTGILCGVWTATFLSSFNTTLVATLVTSISSEFALANEASWLGSSYLASTACFTPVPLLSSSFPRLCQELRLRFNTFDSFLAACATCWGGGEQVSSRCCFYFLGQWDAASLEA